MSKAYDKITAKILELLDDGVVPWRRQWSGTGPLSLRSGREYRGINYLLLGCAPFSSPYWMTFKEAKRRGGSVRKGSKGWPCIYWGEWNKKLGTIDMTGEEETKRVRFLKYYHVFNAEQCEGVADVPALDSCREHVPILPAEQIVNGMPNPPTIEHGATGGASYAPLSDTVHLPPPELFETGEGYYAVAFHELAHSTGHESRLDRASVGQAAFGGQAYGQEELVAEMGAAFLCGRAGISPATIENSAAYIEGWRRNIQADRKLVVVASSQASQAADCVLGVSRG